MNLLRISKKKPTKKQRITRIYSAHIRCHGDKWYIHAHVRLATGENATVFLTDKKGRSSWQTRAEAAATLVWAEKKMAARFSRAVWWGKFLCMIGLHLYRNRMNGSHPERVCERPGCGHREKKWRFGFKSAPLVGGGPAKKKTVDLWCERNPKRAK